MAQNAVHYKVFDKHNKVVQDYWVKPYVCFALIPDLYKKDMADKILYKIFPSGFTKEQIQTYYEAINKWGFRCRLLKDNQIFVKRIPDQTYLKFITPLIAMRYLDEPILEQIVKNWLKFKFARPDICDFKLFQLAHYSVPPYAAGHAFLAGSSHYGKNPRLASVEELKERLKTYVCHPSKGIGTSSLFSEKTISIIGKPTITVKNLDQGLKAYEC